EHGALQPGLRCSLRPGRIPADPDAADSRTASPLTGKKRAQQSPGVRPKHQSYAPGHCLKKVTLTKPTFCHSCSDFIWGLIGFLCEVCNFMCHEKCLKTLRSACSCMAPSLVRVPVAHCFGPAGQKKRFCCVCRKHTEGNTALRCEGQTTTQQPLTFRIYFLPLQDTFHHHWREGNLPSAARCDVCRRSCGSSDVLAGMRCEWCGLTSHAACYLGVPPECTLGRLRGMLLHPSCVRLDSRNFSKMHCYRITESCSQELGKQFLKVFDGDDAVKRGYFRLVSIHRATRKEEVWTLTDAEHLSCRVTSRLPVTAFSLNTGPISNIFVHISHLVSHLKIQQLAFNGLLCCVCVCFRSGTAFVSVSVSKSSTAASVLTEVLGLLHRQVTMSLRLMNQTRFYAVENRKQAVQVCLLIGGLAPLLTREEYDQLLHEHLAIKSHLVTISHFYASQGAVALQISCFSEAERIYMLAKDTTVNSKTLTALVLPEIAHSELGPDVCPLLVFVNPKSGGLKGRELLYSFRKLLNPHQVFDITNGGPLAGLHTFRDVPRFRVLVCGGDGTTGWVLGVLEAVRHKLVYREPPIGIVPLGTGNDLSRVLRWGAGYSGEDPHHILVSVDEADEVLMDRWTILLDAQDISEDGKDNGFLEPPKIVQMNNYFGLGIDAELSLDFHQAREDDPDKFTSRFHNKGVYVKVGLQKISYSRSLHKELQLQVDTQDVPLPNIEGLIFLNIPSWGSGADLWGSEVDGRHEKPSIDDSLLEVVGVTGVVHMGQVQSGLRSGIRIAQGNYIRLTVSKPIPVQVDGEPWIQPPGHIIISAAGPKVCPTVFLRIILLIYRKPRRSTEGK
uniref:Diacylglycerol kinase n=1 Tax=Sander lucioperca TaxID=283035 RepID=A0A8C9YYB7_SANLU